MDLHPIIVHYPVALLSLYSVFEIFSFSSLQKKHYWFYVKAVLVIAGEVGAILAILASVYAGNTSIQGVRIVDIHERFGYATAFLFALISLLYLLTWFGSGKYQKWSARIVFDRWIMIVLSLGGLVFITITGGLGGAIVYGTDFDPFMRSIFDLLNIE